MTRSLEARLARLERERAPALPQQALIVFADTRAEIDRQIANAVHAGRHVQGWPVITVTLSGVSADEP